MIEGLKKMPVTKHNPLEQAIYSNNPFTKGVLRYREIEEGLWLIVTDIEFKANVHTQAIYDNEECEYYFLSYSLYQTEVSIQSTLINKMVLPSQSWSLYRPGYEIDAYHYKGTSGLFFNFTFSKTWADKNLSFKTLPEENQIKKFLNSDVGFVCWADIVKGANELSKEIWQNLETENDGHFNTITLKIQTLKIITDFFKNIQQLSFIEDYSPINETDRKNITKAEKIIKNHLSSTFPGIDYIAQTVSLSPTKLKSCFKAVYGVTLSQYHSEKKMILAKELVVNSSMPIKNIAHAVGYESPGKFSTAFKKQFGVLPSEIRDN
jgi:AraC-like DNA-binding protein